MRVLLASAAIALLIGLSPASAMCGGGSGQQAQNAQGGMCGKSTAAAADDPTADKPSMSMKKTGMDMCGCCKNMAMMDGMKADDPHKGMDMQKQ
jgi:hypothetical protein